MKSSLKMLSFFFFLNISTVNITYFLTPTYIQNLELSIFKFLLLISITYIHKTHRKSLNVNTAEFISLRPFVLVRGSGSAEFTERQVVNITWETVIINSPQNEHPQVKQPQLCTCSFKIYFMVHRVLFQNCSDDIYGQDFKTSKMLNFSKMYVWSPRRAPLNTS